MVTVVLYALAAIAIAAVLVVVLVVVLPDDAISRPDADRVPTGLPPDRAVGADDLSRVRLPVGVRGYRMLDTDAVIDRLVAELEDRDRTIASLRADGASRHRPRPFAEEQDIRPDRWDDPRPTDQPVGQTAVPVGQTELPIDPGPIDPGPIDPESIDPGPSGPHPDASADDVRDDGTDVGADPRARDGWTHPS